MQEEELKKRRKRERGIGIPYNIAKAHVIIILLWKKMKKRKKNMHKLSYDASIITLHCMAIIKVNSHRLRKIFDRSRLYIFYLTTLFG